MSMIMTTAKEAELPGAPAPSPLPRGGIWDYVSPSRLTCWLSCPLRWRFRYADRLELPTTPSLFLGTVSHRALEAYYLQRQKGVTLAPADVVAQLQGFWDQAVGEANLRFETAAEEQDLRSQAAGLLSAYLAGVPQDEIPLAVEASLEAPLEDPVTGEKLGLPLVGILDLVLDGGEGAVIVDFKTTARGNQPMEILHEVQLSSYAWLFRHCQGEKEAGLEIRALVRTKVPKIEFHAYPPRDARHFRRLFSAIRAYLDAVDAGRFHYRPGLGCAMCEHRDQACRKWRG